MEVTKQVLEEYLTQHHQQPVQIVELHDLSDKSITAAETRHGDVPPLKVFGYGHPLLIRYRLGDREECVVLRTATTNAYGHEYRADRAAELLLSFDTYNALPQHIAALDIGIFARAPHTGTNGRVPSQMISLGAGDEFFLLTPYAEGSPYAVDLQRLRDGQPLGTQDIDRARRLADYLVQIHAVKYHEPPQDDPSPNEEQRATLYRRRIRDMVGSGEGILGLTDNYPVDYPLLPAGWLAQVEQACIRWRWQLMPKSHRLCQVHGDFHPFNILFADDGTMTLLDRSRGAWGEAADDVGCLAINYLFFSLQCSGRLAPPFDQLWQTFWQHYLAQTEDRELLSVVIPFLVWRALVLASPRWYNIADSVRRALYHFIEEILSQSTFDPDLINQYCNV